MNRDVLERPFEAELLKTRRGHSGKTLSYVEGTEYIRRLNEAFDGAWSFEIVEHHVLDNEVVVLGKLSAQKLAKVAFGGSSITRNQRTGEALNIADDLKAAATDSLKKASTLFGLGLHLYGEGPRLEDPKADSAKVTRIPRKNPERQEGLTDRQHKAIYAIALGRGWARAALDEHCKGRYGSLPADLSKADASALIDELRESPPDRHAA